MFIDEAEIVVTAGKGGDGVVSFRREKFVPKGGPDGGDGGDGGHVFLRVKENIHGLAGLVATRTYRAEDGQPGRGKQQHGRNGRDVTIDLAPGTLVYRVADTERQLLLDMAAHRDAAIRIARGGRGGLGNVHFASATNQTPREATPGKPGEQLRLALVVQHIADIGIIGLPNVGKSTFLARVSDARPKVANYPFTTLEPNLGVVEHAGARFVMADIPGLIRGAAEGKGLGHQFLKHIVRTSALLHLIDAQSQDPLADYQTVRAELAAFDPELLNRPELVAISRVDTLDERAQRRLWQTVRDLKPIFLSAATGRGVSDLLTALASLVTTGGSTSS
ncbi:GTPase ObgE [Candidatus Berkelbacteria bacterium]|nr:GTPase ObgE [Candidatus Berkelbacteria bacterium]